MQVINRKEQPQLKNIESLQISNFKTEKLDNGTPVYIVDGVEEDLVRIELRFPAGRWYENSMGQSHAATALMRKGTSQKTALQLAEAIEFYGAQLDTSTGTDTTSVSLYTMGKHLQQVLPVATEILNSATFPEKELVLYKERKKQRFKISAQNTDFHANRKITEVLFGSSHPYGYSMQEADIDAIDRNEIIKFYNSHYNAGNASIFVSGNVNDTIISVLNKQFGKYKHERTPVSATDKSIRSDEKDAFYIPLKESVQSSVRIASLSIPKHHPDYPELNVVNTIFGGYFGSRLMSNIREDKGYTYGIHSYITHLKHASYFSIDTEVGNEVCEKAITEIYREMEIMCTDKVENEELDIVKNYMLGTLLRATDGPFNRINIIRNIVLSGLDFTYFDSLVHAIKTVTPERIRDLAQKYLIKGNMKQVICGNLDE